MCSQVCIFNKFDLLILWNSTGFGVSVNFQFQE